MKRRDQILFKITNKISQYLCASGFKNSLTGKCHHQKTVLNSQQFFFINKAFQTWCLLQNNYFKNLYFKLLKHDSGFIFRFINLDSHVQYMRKLLCN